MTNKIVKHKLEHRGHDVGCDALGWCSREDCRDELEEDRAYGNFLSNRGLSVVKVGGMEAHVRSEPVATTAYDELCAIGAELDHHESDLFVRESEAARAVLRKHALRFSSFAAHRPDKSVPVQTWLEVPFAWMPFWRRDPVKEDPSVVWRGEVDGGDVRVRRASERELIVERLHTADSGESTWEATDDGTATHAYELALLARL